MRLILYIAMVWFAVSIPAALLIGRLCRGIHEDLPGESAYVARVPSAAPDRIPAYASLTRSVSLDAAQS